MLVSIRLEVWWSDHIWNMQIQCGVHISAMSHLRFCRATLARDKVAACDFIVARCDFDAACDKQTFWEWTTIHSVFCFSALHRQSKDKTLCYEKPFQPWSLYVMLPSWKLAQRGLSRNRRRRKTVFNTEIPSHRHSTHKYGYVTYYVESTQPHSVNI